MVLKFSRMGCPIETSEKWRRAKNDCDKYKHKSGSVWTEAKEKRGRAKIVIRPKTEKEVKSPSERAASIQKRYLRHLEDNLVPFPIRRTVMDEVSRKSCMTSRSMWFVNLSILSCEDEDQAELSEFMERPEVVHETQIVVNYDRMDTDLNVKIETSIQQIAPDYGGTFYIQKNNDFGRAVSKTKSWMKKIRGLSNPLYYSPPPIPALTIKLSEPLPIDGDLMLEDEE